jgi:putative endonuclease
MKSNSGKKHLGSWGETIAADYLKSQGYRIVQANYRCCYGEIDLICQDGPVWCFVEVKTRKTASFGSGYDAVNYSKQKHMLKAAQHYLMRAGLGDAPGRFDLVSIDFESDAVYRIQLIKNIQLSYRN